jgi:hydrogenase expression/formation protein HypC
MCLAVPGEVLALSDDNELMRMARVDLGGVIKEVSLALTPEARPGDFVLVHVGFAITVIDAAAAERIFAELRALGEVEP